MGPFTAKQKKPRRDSRNPRRSAYTTRKQIGGGCQSIHEVENDPDQIEMEEKLPENQINDSKSKGESQIIREDDLPIVKHSEQPPKERK